MHAQHKFTWQAVFLIVGSLLISLSALAAGESDAVRAIRASAANVPTNIPGIYTYAAPPKGFDPVTASDVELATYGFPPRPDKQTNPDGYAQWERFMKTAKIRWNGELKALPGSGQAMTHAASSPLPETVTTGPQLISTVNASGVILNNTQKTWSSKYSFDYAAAEFTVPVAQFPINTTCTQDDQAFGTWEYTLVGIDDLFFPDGVEGANPAFEPGLLGGVIEGLTNCTPTYYAIYGYAVPGGYINGGVETFAVNPGDVFSATVQVLGPNEGYVFLGDLTQSLNAAYKITTPGPGGSTVQLVGHSAEWVVLRGCCNGPSVYGTWAFPNTISIFFDGGYAETGNGELFYPGSPAKSTQILTMTDDAGDQAIEIVNGQGSSGYQGQHSLWFTTEGCAVDGGCTP